MDILKNKILNYEAGLFEEYCFKRSKLIEDIKLKNNISKENSLIFINDIKAITDSLKNAISSIDYYFTNTDLTKNDSLTTHDEMLFYLLLKRFIFTTGSSELSLETEESSESVSVSDSELSSEELELSPESSSSKSASLTFSSKNALE